MAVVNQKRNMIDHDSSKQEADHHAKNLPRTVWLMTILQAKNITVGIVATCSRRGPDLEPFPPPRKSLLCPTTNCYYRKPPDPAHTHAHQHTYTCTLPFSLSPAHVISQKSCWCPLRYRGLSLGPSLLSLSLSRIISFPTTHTHTHTHQHTYTHPLSPYLSPHTWTQRSR